MMSKWPNRYLERSVNQTVHDSDIRAFFNRRIEIFWTWQHKTKTLVADENVLPLSNTLGRWKLSFCLAWNKHRQHKWASLKIIRLMFQHKPGGQSYLFVHRSVVFGPPVNDGLCRLISDGSPPPLSGPVDALWAPLLFEKYSERINFGVGASNVTTWSFAYEFHHFLLGLWFWCGWSWRRSFILHSNEEVLISQGHSWTGLYILRQTCQPQFSSFLFLYH